MLHCLRSTIQNPEQIWICCSHEPHQNWASRTLAFKADGRMKPWKKLVSKTEARVGVMMLAARFKQYASFHAELTAFACFWHISLNARSPVKFRQRIINNTNLNRVHGKDCAGFFSHWVPLTWLSSIRRSNIVKAGMTSRRGTCNLRCNGRSGNTWKAILVQQFSTVIL